MSTNKAAALMRFLERRVKNGEAATMDPRLVECAVKNAQESLSECDTVFCPPCHTRRMARIERSWADQGSWFEAEPSLSCKEETWGADTVGSAQGGV